MLKIAKKPEWTHEVTVSVPVDGGHENHTCRVRYRLLEEESLDPTDPNNSDTLVRALVARIDDLADEAGKPLEWNDAVRDLVFAMPWVKAALIKGYFRSVTGAREGNSDGPGAPGRKVN